MTSPNGNIFLANGPFCGEFISHRWIPLTKASDVELWCVLWSTPEQTVGVNNRDPGGSRRHRAHYDVTVMPFGRYIYHYNGIFFLYIDIFYTRSFIHSITNPTTFFLSITFRVIVGRDLKQAGVLTPVWKKETGEKRRKWNEKQDRWWWRCGFSQTQTVFATMLFLQ